jgi:hypothetical protein
MRRVQCPTGTPTQQLCNGIFSPGTVFPVIYFANLPKWLKERERNRVEFGMEAVR